MGLKPGIFKFSGAASPHPRAVGRGERSETPVQLPLINQTELLSLS